MHGTRLERPVQAGIRPIWPIENEAGQRVGAVSGPDSTHSGPAEPAATGFSRFCGSPKYGAGFESLRRDTVP